MLHFANKNSETAAEWRRYHARRPQHSDVLDAQENIPKHVCFTVESAPCPPGASTGAHRPSPSAVPVHKNEMSKIRAGRSEEEEETLYIRNRMEEEKEVRPQ